VGGGFRHRIDRQTVIGRLPDAHRARNPTVMDKTYLILVMAVLAALVAYLVVRGRRG
jgi:hypothetical protein